MPVGRLPASGRSCSKSAPVSVETFPIRLPAVSTNQTLPSCPPTMPYGSLDGCGSGYSVNATGLTRTTLLPPNSVYQRFPSGPVVTAIGRLAAVGETRGVKTPLRNGWLQILFALVSAIQNVSAVAASAWRFEAPGTASGPYVP